MCKTNEAIFFSLLTFVIACIIQITIKMPPQDFGAAAFFIATFIGLALAIGKEIYDKFKKGILPNWRQIRWRLLWTCTGSFIGTCIGIAIKGII